MDKKKALEKKNKEEKNSKNTKKVLEEKNKEEKNSKNTKRVLEEKNKEDKNSKNTKKVLEEKNKEDKNSKNIKKVSEKKNKENKKNKKAKKVEEKSKEAKTENELKPEELVNTDKEHTKLINFEEIKSIFKKRKEVPKETLKQLNKPVFQNILMAIIVILYFIFLILGFYNIEFNVYQTDLKVFAICTLLIAIVLLEKAYQKDSGKLAIFGIETIIIAIITLALIYIDIMLQDRYVSIVLSTSYIVAIYYVVKSIILFIRGRKKYFVDDMKEIIDTEE